MFENVPTGNECIQTNRTLHSIQENTVPMVRIQVDGQCERVNVMEQASSYGGKDLVSAKLKIRYFQRNYNNMIPCTI